MPDLHVDLRYRIAQSAQQIGIRATMAAFHCSRNTVRKWLRRFQQHGKPGLRGHSRRPQHVPHQTSSQLETQVVAYRNQIPCYGPKRLKEIFQLILLDGSHCPYSQTEATYPQPQENPQTQERFNPAENAVACLRTSAV